MGKFPFESDAQVGIQEFLDSGIAMGIGYWVPTKSYFKTQYKVGLAIYRALKKPEIKIGYPQQAVH